MKTIRKILFRPLSINFAPCQLYRRKNTTKASRSTFLSTCHAFKLNFLATSATVNADSKSYEQDPQIKPQTKSCMALRKMGH